MPEPSPLLSLPETHPERWPCHRPFSSGSCPVFDAQSRHVGEIARIAREQRAVMDQRDAGYLQVHRTDAEALLAQIQKRVGGGSVPLQDGPMREEFDAFAQSLVGGDLAVGVGQSMNLRKPATQLLLNRDDGSSGVLT